MSRPHTRMRRRAFDDLTNTPCPVCLELAKAGAIQARAVMPLPKFPARLRLDGRQCCRDCQAAETTQAIVKHHPDFSAARLCIANERCEGLAMPIGLMEHVGLCVVGFIDACSKNDLDAHLAWGTKHGIPNDASLQVF